MSRAKWYLPRSLYTIDYLLQYRW